jgi:hypothetical protein
LLHRLQPIKNPIPATNIPPKIPLKMNFLEYRFFFLMMDS